MTKPLKSTTHLWTASPPSFHDAYQTMDSTGRLSTASSPTRSPMTPSTPLRPLGSGGCESGAVIGSPSSKGAQFTIIANVPYDTVRQDLVTEFRKFGRVELAMVVCDEASRHPHKEWTSTAGYAFVRFSKRGEAAAAIQAATMGLITIRGTRVRADWARKDSYAKRGRVSAAQGAPSLGPYGIPDGITMLHDTLSANRQQTSNWDSSPTGELPIGIRLPDIAHLDECDPLVSARIEMNEGGLEDGCSPTSSAAAAVFESLAQALSLRAQSQTEMMGTQSGPIVDRDVCPELMELAINNPECLEEGQQEAVDSPAALGARSPLSALMAAEKLCTQLVDLLSDETSSRRISGSQSTSSSSSDSSSLPHPESPLEDHLHYVDYYPGAPLKSTQIADLLSPTSRGLLSFALSDVVTPNAFPPDVSPICKASSSLRQTGQQHSTTRSAAQVCSPEDLLKLAVSKLPNVHAASCSGIGDESAQTKAGSSSHRSSTSDEADSSIAASIPLSDEETSLL